MWKSFNLVIICILLFDNLPIEGETKRPNVPKKQNDAKAKFSKSKLPPLFQQKILDECVNTMKEPDNAGTRFSGKYLLKNCQKCQTKESLKLMIFIISAPENLFQRNAIRMTWGHYNLRRDVSIAFVLSIEKWDSRNMNHTMIKSEIHNYNDIIIPKYKDSYELLTLKTIFMLNWVRSCCLNAHDFYILKTDDDMLINVPFLLDMIKQIEHDDKTQRKIYGDIHPLNFPYRDGNEKYSVDCDEYRYLMYPNFTSGPAYFYSSNLVNPILDEALKTPFLKLEDVFLTGIVAETMGIPRMHLDSFMNTVNKSLINSCKINELANLMVESSTEDQYLAWSLCNSVKYME